MLSAFHGDEVQFNTMALLEMPIFADTVDKKKVEKKMSLCVSEVLFLDA